MRWILTMNKWWLFLNRWYRFDMIWMDIQFWARVNGGIVKRQLNEFSPVLAPAKKGVLINFVTNCHELHNENAIEICNKLPSYLQADTVCSISCYSYNFTWFKWYRQPKFRFRNQSSNYILTAIFTFDSQPKCGFSTKNTDLL